MKRFVVFVFCILFVIGFGARAQSLDDQYVQIFNLIQEADNLNATSPSQALAKYIEAQNALQAFQRGNPEWNSKIVAFRLTYVANKIASISAKTPIPSEPAELPAKSSPAGGHSSGPADAQVRMVELNNQLAMLQEQVRQAQVDKGLLEAKLKEALAMQPAQSDPRELARAEEKIKLLQKENELLKINLEKQKAQPATALDATTPEQLRQELSQQKELSSRLALEKEALQNRLKNGSSENELASLRLENQLLKKQIEQNQSAKSVPTAFKEPAIQKGKNSAAPMTEMEEQLLIMRARLQALESRAVPYSTEELALMKKPETKLVSSDAAVSKKSVKELPPAAATLVKEAQTYFAAKQYDQAEAAYVQVLRQVPDNVAALANLAAIQIEANHLDAADKTIQKALMLEPQDPYSLYVLGLLRFRQKKYDAALDAFSQCAKLDPQNPEVQNYLGLALSEKGYRVPAEAALRKAVQLQPGYAGAHYNLAIIYMNQQPPALELARWHYQKAIAAGQPHNSELEKKFASSAP